MVVIWIMEIQNILLQQFRSPIKVWMEWQNMISEVRSVVGYEIPLSSDHYGHFDLNNGIRFGKKVEQYRLAWLEDMVPWEYTDQ